MNQPPSSPTPTPTFPPTGLWYASFGPGSLAAFIHRLYNIDPALGARVTFIALNPDFDGIDSSLVVELLYSRDWEVEREVAGGRKGGEEEAKRQLRRVGSWRRREEAFRDCAVEDTPAAETGGDGDSDTLAEKRTSTTDDPTLQQPPRHPFTTLRHRITHITRNPTSATLRGDPDLYIDLVAALLERCTNLEILYVPKKWFGKIGTVGRWGKLNLLGVSEVYFPGVGEGKGGGEDT